jgi:cytochrome c
MPGKLPIPILAGCLAVLACGPVPAAHPERGQALYDTQCRFCHESQVHLRKNHNVTSLEDLQRRVQAWSWHAALGWSDEEVADVAAYLNQRFYHFPEPAAD